MACLLFAPAYGMKAMNDKWRTFGVGKHSTVCARQYVALSRETALNVFNVGFRHRNIARLARRWRPYSQLGMSKSSKYNVLY